jgi:signal transduction histidine kinase
MPRFALGRAPIFLSALAERKDRCDDRRIDRRPLVIATLAVPVAALVVVGFTKARAHPELAPGGGGDVALAVQLVAGLALVAGAVHTARRAELALAGALLAAAAGLALHALPVPVDGAALFTLALLGAGLAPAAAAHAALLHPGGGLGGRGDRAAVATGYLVHLGLLGLLPALVLDPRRSGCYACPPNLLLVHADAAVADWLAGWGPRAAAVTELALAVLVVARLVRRPAASRALAAPVSAAAVAALAAAAVANLRASDELAAGAIDRDLWIATAAALGLVGAGLAWRPLRAARVRAALGRLTVAASASAEDVRGALARALGDPGATVILPHPETGEPIAADGSPAPADASPGRARTTVERRGRVVAWLEHRADLHATPELPSSTAQIAGLTLEREALRAARQLQEQDIRASTVRLVAAGEAERRRLERDLHDGAQQRLLALGLGLARARSAAPADAAEALIDAQARVATVRDELRRIAHGIHSVTLAEGGLAEAVLALVQTAGGGVAVEALPEQRASAQAEAAVYRIVAASLRLRRDAGVRIAIRAHDGGLDAAIRMPGVEAVALTDALAHASARVAVLGGSLAVAAEDGGATARARVPAG